MAGEPIESFSGEWRWLSNFYLVPVPFDGIWYPSVEHAYQAAKTDDPTLRAAIRLAPTPGKAKKMGRTIKLRPDWHTVKMSVMVRLLRQKFKPGTTLAKLLVATNGRELIEDNRWGDTFWGICRGKGENHLGNLLMLQRDRLIADERFRS
jgi:ribA/ribD-fused uncharacterized protein